jgi:hypothetical protein
MSRLTDVVDRRHFPVKLDFRAGFTCWFACRLEFAVRAADQTSDARGAWYVDVANVTDGTRARGREGDLARRCASKRDRSSARIERCVASRGAISITWSVGKPFRRIAAIRMSRQGKPRHKYAAARPCCGFHPYYVWDALRK